MNIIDITSNFPYLGFRQTAEYSEIIYNINSKTLGVAISINEKYKRIEIRSDAFYEQETLLLRTLFVTAGEFPAIGKRHGEGMNFNLSPKKIFEVTSLIPRLTIPRSDLNEWLLAFNELSKFNKLKSIKASKEHLKEIIEEL